LFVCSKKPETKKTTVVLAMAGNPTYTLIFAAGGAYFTLACIVALVISALLWLWRRRVYPSVLSALQFLMLAGAWWLMLLEFWPKQRADGREFPWYRDVALVFSLTLQTWIVASALHIVTVDGAFVIFLTLGGGIALVLGNFTVYPQGWWGVGSYIGVLAVVQFMLLRGSRTSHWRAWAIYLSSLICVIGLPLVQVLSWTMMEAADKNPHRKISEIVYLVVAAVGFTVNGVLSTLFYSPHSDIHKCDTVLAMPDATPVTAQPFEQPPPSATPPPQQQGARVDSSRRRRAQPPPPLMPFDSAS
jgi:hypothetical protein